MGNAKQVYDENIGHSHDAAVNAVYGAGFADGQATGTGVTETQTVTIDPNPELESDIANLNTKIAALETTVADQAAHITSLETEIEQAQHDLVSEQSANALLVEQNKALQPAASQV